MRSQKRHETNSLSTFVLYVTFHLCAISLLARKSSRLISLHRFPFTSAIRAEIWSNELSFDCGKSKTPPPTEYSPPYASNQTPCLYPPAPFCGLSNRLYLSVRPYTYQRPLAPPKAVPRQERPVTSWNGRVEISLPAPATPMMMLSPQPLWQASNATRMTSVLPMHSNV